MAETTTPYEYSYPIDEESITPSKIVFDVERLETTVTGEVSNQPIQNVPEDATQEEAESLAQQISTQIVSGVESLLGGSASAEYEREEVPVGKIQLYLPPEIQFQDGVTFDETSFGTAFGRAALGVAEGGVSLKTEAIGNAVRGGINSISSFLDELKSPNGRSDLAMGIASAVAKNSSYLAQRFGTEEVAGVAAIATQTTLNPNSRVLFKSVNLRSFQFSFTLIPTSREEAEAIKAIVKQFRTELYPEEIAVGVVPFGYKFPNRFIISFFHGENQIAYRLQPAYLTDMTTSFNSGGRGFFEDGNFTETTISLSFKEYKALSRQDVEAGY